MRVVAVVQARCGSTRLPRKVLLDLAGEPMLARVITRLRPAETLDEVVVATTRESADDEIAGLCVARNWPLFRGSESDVLDRYYHAAIAHRADVIVRVTSDCPFIEPGIVDHVVREFRKQGVDYASNVAPRSFPRGLDTEVFSATTLERLWREDNNPAWREHVTAFIHKRPELFRTHNVLTERDWSHLRWTVDTAEDLTFARLIFEHFGRDNFSWREVIAILEQHPEWNEINREVPQKAVV